MGEKLFSKSDTGAKAAWKGFSSQTTYIASRLINLQDNYKFYPEQVEDLLIKEDEIVKEIVQVKNLSSNLSLSDFKPNDNDSFFRRCLSYKESNPNVVLKIVSFGEIGLELKNINNTNSIEFSRLRKKLLDEGYVDEGIYWISRQLCIEKVDEVQLLELIRSHLKSSVETMGAPNVFLDSLTQYISNLSRYSECTTKKLWLEKTQKISMEIASLRGFITEYGKSIIPMLEYKQSKNTKKLEKEYQAGINAKPQHIRLNLDIERTEWIEQIDNYFLEDDLVVIKGASGQGKSSLSYRYLYNYYVESNVFCIQQVSSEDQAQNIVTALNGLAKNHENMIVYYDVSPQDTNWVWISEKFFEYGTNLKMLISIREEDFRRSKFDNSNISARFMDLNLSKLEAEELYKKHIGNEFRDFEESWRSFGEQGPLMEYVYMLNESQTLKQKLTSQMRRIVSTDHYSENWLEVLLIVSYAGQYGIKINFEKLFSHLSVKNKAEMFFLFEHEYLLKVSADKKQIDTLHVLRANLISEILLDYLIISEKEVIGKVLNSINDNVFLLLISFFYDNVIDDELLEYLSNVEYGSWSYYSSVIKSLIWSELRKYYLCNKADFIELDTHFPGKFPLVMLGDVTSYYPNYDGEELLGILKKFQPERVKLIEETLTNLKSKKISFQSIDKFLSRTMKKLPSYLEINDEEFNSMGYGLFWMANRNFYINENDIFIPNGILNRDDLLESLLNLLVGIQKQNMSQLYKELYPKLLEKIKKKYAIVWLSESETLYDGLAIVNMYDENKSKVQFDNEHIMSIIGALRRLSIGKAQYNMQLIGEQIVENIEVPEIIKAIKAVNLPWLWITEINGWLSKLHEYELLPPYWEEAHKNIKICMQQNIEIIQDMTNALEYVYKKRNFGKIDIKKLISKVNDTKVQLNNSFLYYPKTSVDKFGVNNERVIVRESNTPISSTNHSLGFLKIEDKNKLFSQLFSKFRTSLNTFYGNMDNLLLERLKNQELSKKSRLSHLNLLDSITILKEMMHEYNKEFPLEKKSIISKEGYDKFLMFASLWSYLYQNKLRINRNIKYDRKLYMKNYQKGIEDFFEYRIHKYQGVINVNKRDKNYILHADYPHLEQVFKQLVKDFKLKFPEINLLTIENILWTQSFNRLLILPEFLGKKIPPTYEIESKKFAYIDDVDQLMITTKTSENVEIHDKLLESFIKYNSLQAALSTIFTHTSQVNHKLEEKISCSEFNEEVYEEWKVNMIKFTIETLNEILKSIDFVKQEVLPFYNKEEILNEIVLKYKDMVSNFKEELPIIVSAKNQKHGHKYINKINEISNILTENVGEIMEAIILNR